jgi:hypothetical protein
MASVEGLNNAIGCLSVIYPEFVAKELATLTDGIASAIQGFTDPLAAVADLNVDSLVDDVATLSKGDVFDNLGQAAVGLASQYARREAEEMLTAMAAEYASPTKRVQEIRNISNGIISGAYTVISLYSDMPYAAAQKICETIILLDDLKVKNLRCLKKHITQLTNSVLVLVENATEYKDNTLENLALAKEQVDAANTILASTQNIVDGELVFDQAAFDRSREALIVANRYLTPDKDGTSILDAVDILTSGSVEAGQVNRANQALVHLAIPSLINLIQVEMSAVTAQVEVINFYVTRLAELIGSYRASGSSSRVKTERARAVAAIQKKLSSISAEIDLAVQRGSISNASFKMLDWSSKVKTLIATMNKVKALSLQEGSIEGPDKAFALENALQKVLNDMADINVGSTTGGIEDTTVFSSQVLSLTKYAKRIVEDIELGEIAPNTLATFHLLAAETAGVQLGRCDESVSVALRQRGICEEFAAIELGTKEKFDSLLSSMKQVGLDRGVDMLSSGQFEEFLSADLDTLSYLGAGIKCLTDALTEIDDFQTRKQITDIRDGMVAKKSNEDLALADSADQGRSRFISRLQKDMASIQKNAKTVESIVTTLKELQKSLGGAFDESFGSLSLDAFSANLDHLSVGAGGRLSDGLEEYSQHPNAGVPLCESV